MTTSEGYRSYSQVVVGAQPMALRLTDGSRERLVAMEPVADQPPAVALRELARDTVLRMPPAASPFALMRPTTMESRARRSTTS